jgi:glutamate 5-kinase
MQARKYWLRHAPAAPGRIHVDAGAVRALAGGRASLLPGGVLEVSGEFHRGDLVEIVDDAGRHVARGLSQYGIAEARRLAGRHSREIESLLGYSYGAEIVHRDDLATVGEIETGEGDA